MRAGDERTGLAAEAAIFGFPLVMAVRHICRLAAQGIGPIPAVGFNTFAHQAEPPGPLAPILEINSDVLVSIAQIDLDPGPLIMHVPPTGGRYYVVQLFDAWMNPFAYIGLRSVGADGVDCLIVPPGWTAQHPAATAALATSSMPTSPPPASPLPASSMPASSMPAPSVPASSTPESSVPASPVGAWNGGRAAGAAAGGAPSATATLAPPMPVVEAPTRVLMAVVRIAYRGPGDLPAVTGLQQQLSLRPADPDAPPAPGPPEHSRQVCDDLRFWEEFRMWMREFPPSQPELDYARRFEALGLLESLSPYIDPEPRLVWALRKGFQHARDRLEQLAEVGRASRQGWVSTLHEADYSIDHVGLGMLDDPRWMMQDRAQARIGRALAARTLFKVVHAYEMTSARCAVDATGHPLTGARSYLLRLAPPPVDAFWSLTVYEEPEGYLVANPIGRYSIDSRDDRLVHDREGTVPIMIQFDQPPGVGQAADSDARAFDAENLGVGNLGAEKVNWLPAPASDFRLVLRMYLPRGPVLDGSYAPAPVRRLA